MSTPPLEYQHPNAADAGKRPKTTGAIVGWSVVGLLMLLAAVSCLLPSLGRARESANRVKCASNLKQIGQAALLYSTENRNHYPSDFVMLLATQDLVPGVFTCPSSNVDKATGPTTQAVIDEIHRGRHLSYAWTGGGLLNSAPADVVLAFDLENHQPRDSAVGVGINVLLGDGTVRFVDEQTAKAIVAQFYAGVRPIRMPTATTMPASN